MIKKPVVLISLLLACMAMLFTVGAAYSLYSKKQHDIDPKVREISGIEFDKKLRLWAINDSGDGPKLYMLNDDGSVAREVTVTNAKNIDWEDMTQNEFGHFFLGDFGNNENNRRWLTIYKIENPIDIKTDTTEAEIIKFTYPEMDGTPVEPHQKNFDLEAFIEFDHNLYLFTKNRTAPFDGITNVYKVGDHAANFNAEKIDAFKTCTTLDNFSSHQSRQKKVSIVRLNVNMAIREFSVRPIFLRRYLQNRFRVNYTKRGRYLLRQQYAGIYR